MTTSENIHPVAIVNGGLVDQFNRSYLTRPTEFTAKLERERADAKQRALAAERYRLDHPEEFTPDDPELYDAKEREHRERLRTENTLLAEDIFLLTAHAKWLATWQNGPYIAREIRQLNKQINKLIEYRRHLIERFFDREHTSETLGTIERKSRRRKAISAELKATRKSAKPSTVEKRLAGLTEEQIQTLIAATGKTREELAQLVGR